MSKYSRQELITMAKKALNAKSNNDYRYVELIMGLSVKLGLDPVVIERRIEVMAKS